ncbi:ankyrin repeat domain-containing protein [Kitasatospora cineracea]
MTPAPEPDRRAPDLTARLVEAVRGGDAGAADALCRAGADPDAVDGHGTPVLSLAVRAFDDPTAQALVAAYASPDRTDALGRSPLHLAVELGCSDLFRLFAGHGAQLWRPDADGRDALALARHWHGVDLAAELRRRSGLAGPVEQRTVRSEAGVCERLSLGGHAFLTGHAALLTGLEGSYGVPAPAAELLARALAAPDLDHVVWSETIRAVAERRTPAGHHTGWDFAAALRDRPDPRERYFGAEVLRTVHFSTEINGYRDGDGDRNENGAGDGDGDDNPFDAPLVDLLLPWLAAEPDHRVVLALTAGLGAARDGRAAEPLRALTRHPDRRVRIAARTGLAGRG